MTDPTRVLIAGDWHGLCQCGCGGLTPLAPRTDSAKCWRKGQPLRFIRGHAGSSPIEPARPVPDPGGGATEVFAIPLRGVKAAGRVALVDAADLPALSQHRWHVWEHERGARRRTSGPYAVDGSGVRMHRLLTGWNETDHRNGDGLDNRRCNLRSALEGENARNQRPLARSSSAYKGVFWFARDRKWAAQINRDGRSTHLGYFADEEAAARAYDCAAIAAWGEYANPNFGGWR